MYWHTYDYQTSLDKAGYLEKINELIQIHEKNTMSSHSPWNGNIPEKIRGEINENEFIFWRTNYWFGSIYPIFKGKYIESKSGNFLRIKVRLNPMAELIAILTFVGISSLLIPYILLQPNQKLETLVIRLIGVILLIIILQSVPLINYYDLKNQTIKGLETYLELNRGRFKIEKQR